MNDYDLEVIGNFIAERRKMFGYTQTQLAELINASHKTVSKWETGHSFPDLCYQVELCRLLKIHLSELHAGKLNKKLRIKNALNKVLLFFFLLIIVILLPAFFYLINYYNKSYDSFKVYKINGLSNNERVITGYFIDYYEYSTLIIDTQSLENIIPSNKTFSVDIIYNDSLIYSFNKLSLEEIIIDKDYDIDDNWSFKIKVNNELLHSGNFYFNSSVNNTPFVEYKASTIDTKEIINRLKKSGFKKVNENEYVKKISKNEKIHYYTDDNKMYYYYRDGNVSKTAEYHINNDSLYYYIYYSNSSSIILIEKMLHSFFKNESICYVNECLNANNMIDIISKYRSLLKGE